MDKACEKNSYNVGVSKGWGFKQKSRICQECFKHKDFGHTQIRVQYTLPLNQKENDFCQPTSVSCSPLPSSLGAKWFCCSVSIHHPYIKGILATPQKLPYQQQGFNKGLAFRVFLAPQTGVSQGAMRMMVHPRTWSKYLLQWTNTPLKTNMTLYVQ